MYDLMWREIRIIQKWWKKYSRFNLVNSDDVFTLEPINVKKLSFHHCYVYDNKTKQKYIFDSFSLMQYILTTGNFSNPYTRKDFSKLKLKYIFAKYLNCQHFLSITYKHKENHTITFDESCDILNEIEDIRKHYKIIKEEEEYLEFLLNEVNTLLSDMLDRSFYNNQIQNNQVKFLRNINYIQEQIPVLTEIFKHLKLYNRMEIKQDINRSVEEKIKVAYEYIYSNFASDEDLIWNNNMLIFLEEIILRELEIIFD